MSNFIFCMFLILGLNFESNYQNFTAQQCTEEQSPRVCAMYSMTDVRVLEVLPCPQSLNMTDVTALRDRELLRLLFSARDAETEDEKAEYLSMYFKAAAKGVSLCSKEFGNPPRTGEEYSAIMCMNIDRLYYNVHMKKFMDNP